MLTVWLPPEMWLPDVIGDRRVILGSSLPRRAEILETNLGLTQFEVFPSQFAEDLPKAGKTVEQYVSQTCRCKAEEITTRLKGDEPYVLICCDTVIDCDGKVREKPKTAERQREMIQEYRSLGDIRVISAVTVISGSGAGGRIEGEATGVCTTRLKFNKQVDDSWIDQYVAGGEGLEVAGGFKYQEKGSYLFENIEGDYFNIVGLPVATTHRLIEQVLTKN